MSKDIIALYKAKKSPEIIEVPSLTFVTLEGEGDPNEIGFQEDVAALYSMSYKVRMAYKRQDPPKGYIPFKVSPLEGVWDLIDYEKPSSDKNNLKYKIMIRQPVFFTQDLFDQYLEEIKKSGKVINANKLKYEIIQEGLCCQMLHIGPYDNEIDTFMEMEAFINENGFNRVSKIHREIYLSDPRRSKPENLKTILRFNVKKR